MNAHTRTGSGMLIARVGALGLLVAASAALPGCLIGASSSTTVTGSYVGSQTLETIKPGQTKRDYVLATLGQPTHKSKLDDGGEVWRYCYTKHSSSHGHIFLVLSASGRDVVVRTTFVSIDADGVVTRVWQESSEVRN